MLMVLGGCAAIRDGMTAVANALYPPPQVQSVTAPALAVQTPATVAVVVADSAIAGGQAAVVRSASERALIASGVAVVDVPASAGAVVTVRISDLRVVREVVPSQQGSSITTCEAHVVLVGELILGDGQKGWVSTTTYSTDVRDDRDVEPVLSAAAQAMAAALGSALASARGTAPPITAPTP